MFFYQIQEAILKFQKNPMIISSETLDIRDIPPPLLIICSARQYKYSKVKMAESRILLMEHKYPPPLLIFIFFFLFLLILG